MFRVIEDTIGFPGDRYAADGKRLSREPSSFGFLSAEKNRRPWDGAKRNRRRLVRDADRPFMVRAR